TPAGSVPQAVTGTDTAPPVVQAVGALRGVCFRGSMARPSHFLSTLRPPDPPGGRKTRFWLLARLYLVGFATPRVPSKGSRLPPFPPSPCSRAARPPQPSGGGRRATL